jgi:hypothetical protein
MLWALALESNPCSRLTRETQTRRTGKITISFQFRHCKLKGATEAMTWSILRICIRKGNMTCCGISSRKLARSLQQEATQVRRMQSDVWAGATPRPPSTLPAQQPLRLTGAQRRLFFAPVHQEDWGFMHRYVLRPQNDLWRSNIERELDKKRELEGISKFSHLFTRFVVYLMSLLALPGIPWARGLPCVDGISCEVWRCEVLFGLFPGSTEETLVWQYNLSWGPLELGTVDLSRRLDNKQISKSFLKIYLLFDIIMQSYRKRCRTILVIMSHKLQLPN